MVGLLGAGDGGGGDGVDGLAVSFQNLFAAVSLTQGGVVERTGKRWAVLGRELPTCGGCVHVGVTCYFKMARGP